MRSGGWQVRLMGKCKGDLMRPVQPKRDIRQYIQTSYLSMFQFKQVNTLQQIISKTRLSIYLIDSSMYKPYPNVYEPTNLYESANKENRINVENLQHMCNFVSKLKNQVGNGERSGAEVCAVLSHMIKQRQRIHNEELNKKKENMKGLQEEAYRCQKESQECYKQLDKYLQVKKQQQINQRLITSIRKKEQQLQQFVALNKKTHEQISKQVSAHTTQLETKKNRIRDLEDKKESIEANLSKWKENRFNLNRKSMRQERLNRDMDEQIRAVDQKIEKEVIFDEKIRLHNLKKMQQRECQFSKSNDLNHEQLRTIEEKNHGLKLLIMNLSHVLQQKQENCANIMPMETIEKKLKTLKDLKSKIAGNQEKLTILEGQRKQLQELKVKIINIKDEDKIKEEADPIRFQIDTLESQCKDLDGKRKVLKEQIEDLNQKIKTKQAQIHKYKQTNKEIQTPQPQPSKLKQPEKPHHQKPHKKSTKKQTKPDENLKTFTKKKETSFVSFAFTVFYLLVLVIFACNYNKIDLYIRAHYYGIKSQYRFSP